MPRPATRLLTLIMLLQRRPRQKAGDLAAALGVSVRTVHRYMEMLEEMGIPIYSERGPSGGFSLVRGYKMPPLVFTPEEAVAVFLGTGLVTQMWGQLYAEGAHGALAKLENVLPDDQRQEAAWASRSFISSGLNRTAVGPMTPLLTTLRQSIREQRTVHMAYERASEPRLTVRDFDPYALVHRSGWWYMVGYCHLRDAMRTFRVDRVTRLEPTDVPFALPPEFDIHDYLEREWRSFGALRVIVRFLPEGASFAREVQQQWDEMQELPDGSLRVTYTVPDLNWAASMVLSYGGLVVAEEP
ncbi:MAG: helix-turn-helix transcriptional regulator, partial [Caldilineaceae bacterium]